MTILVGSVHIVLFHNLDDTFDTYLLPNEIGVSYKKADDIKRICHTIKQCATCDYKTKNER